MPTNSSYYSMEPDTRSPDSKRIYRIIFWISIIIVLTLSVLDLIGWVFDLSILKSIGVQWTPMRMISAICFILSVSAIIVIKEDFLSHFRKPVINIISSILAL